MKSDYEKSNGIFADGHADYQLQFRKENGK